MRTTAILLFFVFLTNSALAEKSNITLPDDIKKYIARYEMCEHWIGEEAYSEERGNQIMDGYLKYCNFPDIDETRKILIKKYKTNKVISKKLSEYDELL